MASQQKAPAAKQTSKAKPTPTPTPTPKLEEDIFGNDSLSNQAEDEDFLGTAKKAPFDLDDDGEGLVFDLEEIDENMAVGGSYVPAGIYECIVDEVEYKTSNSGNKMLAWKYKCLHPDYPNTNFYDYTVLTNSKENHKKDERGMAKLKKTLIILGLAENLQGFSPKAFVDNGDAIGVALKVKVKIRPYEGEKRNSVVEIMETENKEIF